MPRLPIPAYTAFALAMIGPLNSLRNDSDRMRL